MKPRIRSRIAAAVFASMTLLLPLSLVLTPARSAQKPSLLYATAEAGTKLIAISLRPGGSGLSAILTSLFRSHWPPVRRAE